MHDKNEFHGFLINNRVVISNSYLFIVFDYNHK